MSFTRSAPAAAVIAASFLASSAQALSLSRITCKPNADGTKSISPETFSTPGDPNNPQAIVSILSCTIRITDPVANGLMLRRTTLDNTEAFGQGRPGGYAGGGPRNPSGPWQGLLWPYRDFNDGYATPAAGTGGLPEGNDVGTFVQTGANDYIVRDIAGGMAFNTADPASWMRGLPGNGATDYARFFAFDLVSISTEVRNVTITVEDLVVRVLVYDAGSDAFRTVTETAQGSTFVQMVPAPSSAALLLLGALPLARRRR